MAGKRARAEDSPAAIIVKRPRTTAYQKGDSTTNGSQQPAPRRNGRSVDDRSRHHEKELSDHDSALDSHLGHGNHGTPRAMAQSSKRQSGNTPHRNHKGKLLFSTPQKGSPSTKPTATPSRVRNADRSARRKSNRALLRTVVDNVSDEDELEDILAEEINGSEDNADDVQDEQDGLGSDVPEQQEPVTPSKRRRRRKSPTPDLPRDLPPHEEYFAQNRPGKAKTSNANLSNLALLDHEEYFALLRDYEDPHRAEIEYLKDLHCRSFSQWRFELHENFNICIFGWGSKRDVLLSFADYLHKSSTPNMQRRTVIVNGYVQTLTIKDILNTIAAAITNDTIKLGSQPASMLENLLALLEENPDTLVTLVVHSIDRSPLRKLATQSILAQLSSHPQVQMIASADHPNFPLMWDTSLRSTFNFLFHDCTTFKAYTVERDVVEDVHELLGRSGRRVGGKEGVTFVLKSLNDNSRNLFRVLVAEQLASMDDDPASPKHADDAPRASDKVGRAADVGVEYRVLYHKAVEEFICSNETNFRTLLKEFHDHQMIQSRKDALGTEFLAVPFRREELETILEDMAG